MKGSTNCILIGLASYDIILILTRWYYCWVFLVFKVDSETQLFSRVAWLKIEQFGQFWPTVCFSLSEGGRKGGEKIQSIVTISLICWILMLSKLYLSESSCCVGIVCDILTSTSIRNSSPSSCFSSSSWKELPPLTFPSKIKGQKKFVLSFFSLLYFFQCGKRRMFGSLPLQKKNVLFWWGLWVGVSWGGRAGCSNFPARHVLRLSY